MRVIRGAEAPRVRWRNGGGWTREIARQPSSLPAAVGGDAFDWRVSVAEVEADGPFSAFVGYDRILVLLAGAGMHLHLTDTGAKISVRPVHRVARFAGAARVDAVLIDAATTDLNLIWRHDAFEATVHEVAARVALPAVQPGAQAIVYVADGELVPAVGLPPAGAGDLVVGDPGEQLTGRCSGRSIAFQLQPRPESCPT